MIRFTATSHRSIDDPVHYEHWNRCHVRGQENDNLPVFWTDFHTQEMLRCLIEFLEETYLAPVCHQRFCISVRELPFPSPEQMGWSPSRLAANMRCRIARSWKVFQVSRLQGNKWCRQTEPAYACASGDSGGLSCSMPEQPARLNRMSVTQGAQSGSACTPPACD